MSCLCLRSTRGEFKRNLKRCLIILWVGAPLLLMGLATAADAQGSETKEATASLEEKWGVKPVSIRLTAADHFLDFRYRVTNPDKAVTVLSRKEKAYLVDQETGKVFPVPVTKLGPLRATAVKPKANREYVILFANVNKTIKDGSRVSVIIGDFKAENLTVGGGGPRPEDLPEAKQRKWEVTQQTLRKEYGVCMEHCGKDQNCLDKCERAYQSRLDKEYQTLLYEN